MKPRTAKRRQASALERGRFIVLPENQSAQRGVRRLTKHELKHAQRRNAFPLLFLHGPPGTGKSHLVRGLIDGVSESAGRTARIVAARELGQILTVSPVPGEKPVRDFHECDLLVIEDVQHLPVNASEALANLIDHRGVRLRSTVVTGLTGPATLKSQPLRLTSRLAAGLVVGLEPLSPSSRRKLAAVFCLERGLHVADDVIGWLARQPTGGARPILGDIARLERLSLTHPPPLDLATVKAELPDNPEEDASAIKRITARVAEHYGVKANQLKGRDRQRNLLWPRHVGMYLARHLTKLSLVRIGTFFGGYDHSTVLYACRKVEKTLKEDQNLANDLKVMRCTIE